MDGTIFQMTCGICGTVETATLRTHSEGAPDFHFADFLRVPYGRYNPRILWCCKTHREAEIKAKIEDLE